MGLNTKATQQRQEQGTLGTYIKLTEQEGAAVYTRKASKTQVRLMRVGTDNHSGGKTTKTGSVK